MRIRQSVTVEREEVRIGALSGGFEMEKESLLWYIPLGKPNRASPSRLRPAQKFAAVPCTATIDLALSRSRTAN